MARRFEFVTDFLGGGEMGCGWRLHPAALEHAPGPAPTWNRPDPDEYVRIRGDQLRPLNSRYEIRVTNELEEATFIDRLELVAVDHAADVVSVPERGTESGPQSVPTVHGEGADAACHARSTITATMCAPLSQRWTAAIPTTSRSARFAGTRNRTG